MVYPCLKYFSTMQLVTLFVSVFSVVLASSITPPPPRVSELTRQLSRASLSPETTRSSSSTPSIMIPVRRSRSGSDHAMDELPPFEPLNRIAVFSPNDLKEASPMMRKDFTDYFSSYPPYPPSSPHDIHSQSKQITGAISEDEKECDSPDSDRNSEDLMMFKMDQNEKNEEDQILRQNLNLMRNLQKRSSK